MNHLRHYKTFSNIYLLYAKGIDWKYSDNRHILKSNQKNSDNYDYKILQKIVILVSTSPVLDMYFSDYFDSLYSNLVLAASKFP